MDKENTKHLQEKFEELKLVNEKHEFQKFMDLHEKINAYSQDIEKEIFIGLDNSTGIVNF